MRIIVSISCLWLLFIFSAYGQNEFPQPEYYIDVVVDDVVEIQKFADLFSIDRVMQNPDNGQYDVRLWIPGKSFASFQDLAIPYTIVSESSKSVGMTHSHLYLLKYWNAYPTYQAYLRTLRYFADLHQDICTIDTILDCTPNGRIIPVIHIRKDDHQPKPSVFLSSTIHGDEVTGYYLLLRLADFILSNRGDLRVQDILEQIDLWICPLENPDGTYFSGNNIVGPSPVSTRGNANQVDLNRNYPFINGAQNEVYEPETMAFMQFFEQHNITLSAAIHGGAELFNYPWDTYRSAMVTHPDEKWWIALGNQFVAYSREHLSSYMQTVPSGVTAGGNWYVILGSRQDYVTYYQQGREVTIEVSRQKVLPPQQLQQLWQITQHSLLLFILNGANGIRGRVFDATTQQPVNATIFIENHDEISQNSFVLTNQNGNYYRLIEPGNYWVTCTAEGYEPQMKNVSSYLYGFVNLDFNLSPTAIPIYSKEKCQVYPTIVNQMITVEFLEMPTENASCQIYTINGKLLCSYELSEKKNELNVSHLSPGFYLLCIQKEGVFENLKFIKQ